jgi:DNA-binding MarR family transcriptional regulator
MNHPHNARKRSISVKMTVLARQLRQGFDERVETAGVTRAQFGVIAAVMASPNATQRELAARLEVTDVTACRLIDRLVAAGLLERQEHAQDRRAYRVTLTKSAHPIMAKLAAAAETYEAEVFANLDSAEIDRFNALLIRISENLSGAKEERQGRRAKHPFA